MLTMIAADSDGDAAAARAAAVADTGYLLQIAHGLASAIAAQHPEAFTGLVDTPTAMLCTILTSHAGDVVLTELITRDPTSVNQALEAFVAATGVSATAVIGPLATLRDPDATAVAAAAHAMLEAALVFSRAAPGSTTGG